MIISIPRERFDGETRVAATPETIRQYISWGFDVQIEQDAGLRADFSDSAYQTAGAKIISDTSTLWKTADVILKIWAPLEEEERFITSKQIIIANFQNKKDINTITNQSATCFALNKIPRISRAQNMDILSSQNNLSGYRAVIEAVNLLPQVVPLMMTAAGTVPPIKFLVLGAGVAGLQAIATAKRLGGQVYASDVRAQAKEQVESLGGKFLQVVDDTNFEAADGYAKETSEAYQEKQRQLLSDQLQKTDVVITTALIPNKPAPRLISAEMLSNMKEGSIIIDMAAAEGGNVEGSQNNQTKKINGITLLGNSNLAAKVSNTASTLYARNILNFLKTAYNPDTKNLAFDFSDEIIAKTCICKDGKLQGETL